MDNLLRTAFGLAILASILTACSTGGQNHKLPILGHREPVTREVNGKTVTDTVYQQIPAFTFLNQDSTVITPQTFDNSVYIANFFFTSCPSICPTMQRNLLKVYEKYKGRNDVKFLSHSIDFKHDKPSKLKWYADRLGVEGTQWQFAYGPKEDIYGISAKYMVFTAEDDQAPGGYDHSGYLILVDREKHIRGAYDGTDDEQVALLLEDLEVLLDEYR